MPLDKTGFKEAPETRMNSGRGERIRTFDPLVPNQMRYQAALHPDSAHSNLRVFALGPGLGPVAPIFAPWPRFLPFAYAPATALARAR